MMQSSLTHPNLQELHMKVLIAVDMEGISGVVDRSHVDRTTAEYQRFRKLMTEDVNAAIRGAYKAGADEIVVSDGHGGARNILIEELDPLARLNSGSRVPMQMLQGIDKGVDAVLFVGYHAMHGAQDAILSHTMSSAKIGNLWINDRVTGEIGLNAGICGYYNVPILMISSDQTACAEAEQFVPGIEKAVVKIANSRTAAELLPLKESQALIETTAEKAVRRFIDGTAPKPYIVSTPVRVKIEYFHAALADSASLLPGAKRLDGRTVEFETSNMLEAGLTFGAAVSVA